MAAGAALLLGSPAATPAQSTSPSIAFLGFQPGLPRAEVEARLADRSGRWVCAASRDPRLADCRGSLVDPRDGTLTLTGALVDGALAILVIRGPLGEAGLERWRRDLEAHYGSVTPTSDHGQETWQWIRQRRMLRLTTRREAGTRIVSVTLVDGPLLDGLHAPPPGEP